MKCVNCGMTGEIPATGIYEGYVKCSECGFLKQKLVDKISNIIMPDDPMDAMMCESCQ